MKLTLQRVRALARLRRVDPEGADAELRVLLQEHRTDLAELLALEEPSVPLAESLSAPAELLALVEEVTGSRALSRREAGMKQASALAERIATEATRSLQGVLLPLVAVGELAQLPGFEEIVFVIGGQRHGLPRLLLASVLKQLRSAELGTVMLTPAPRLRIPYCTPQSRGVLDLRLRPAVSPSECVVVDLDGIAPTPPRRRVYSDPHTSPGTPEVPPAYLEQLRGAA